jgi:hypothetical protein
MALKKADILSNQSPKDIRLYLSKLHLAELNDCNMISEMPSKFEKFNAKLDLIFSLKSGVKVR